MASMVRYYFYWIFYSFTFHMLSPFLIPPNFPSHHSPASLRLYTHLSAHSCILPSHSPTSGHQASTGPRTSSPIDARQGHPLLHIRLEPWVPLCVLLGWWFRPWELWLVDIVLPMGLQTPSAPKGCPDVSGI